MTGGQNQSHTETTSVVEGLSKVSTEIGGFDEITGGGLPQGRPTLVCGGAGCGKTLFLTGPTSIRS